MRGSCCSFVPCSAILADKVGELFVIEAFRPVLERRVAVHFLPKECLVVFEFTQGSAEEGRLHASTDGRGGYCLTSGQCRNDIPQPFVLSCHWVTSMPRDSGVSCVLYIITNK